MYFMGVFRYQVLYTIRRLTEPHIFGLTNIREALLMFTITDVLSQWIVAMEAPCLVVGMCHLCCVCVCTWCSASAEFMVRWWLGGLEAGLVLWTTAS